MNDRAKSKPLQPTKPLPAACNTAEFSGDSGDSGADLINVDDDSRGIRWRKLYMSEIRRKSKGEIGRGYRIVKCGVNVHRDYYEKLEWNLMFEKQNVNTYRYWNHDGSFYEYFPDWSDYFSKDADHERYITPKCGGFVRTKKNGARMMKSPPFFKRLVDEGGLDNVRGPGHSSGPPWTRRKAKQNKAALSRQHKNRR